MKQFCKRTLSCLLAALLLCGLLATTAFAAPPGRTESGQEASEQLYALGLMQGAGTLSDGGVDFAVGRTMTRVEGVTMVVRLLGGEAEAKAANYAHPFTDVPDWAAPYVGYAYRYDVAQGAGGNTFNALSTISLQEFITLLLRALGHGDVDWRAPYTTADAAGLYYPTAKDGFYRGDAAAICLDALSCQVAGRGVTLLEKLRQDGAVSAGAQAPAGVFVPGPVAPLVTEFTVSGPDRFIDQLVSATMGHSSTIAISVPRGTAGDYLQRIDEAMFSLSSPFSEAKGYGASYYSSSITYTPSYTDAVRVMAWLEGRSDSLSAADRQLLAKAQEVHASLVSPGMSEYQQVKAFHDWLVNNNRYDMSFNDTSFDAYGAFLTGRAVCDGYSKAFDLLCYLSGIECVRINGQGNGGGHAWNKVKIDGQWYNVDVTWDDPANVSTLLYKYFLVSDSVLDRDHDWIQYSFWPVAPANYK